MSGPATLLSPLAYQLLQTLPALRGLSEVDREDIAGLFREQCLAKGAIVMREGDPGTSLYIVVSGEVEVSAGGRVVARLGPGEWFGEMAVVTRANRSATVQVALDCQLLVLDDEAFGRLLARHPRLYEEVAAIVSRRLSRTLRGEGARRHHIVAVDNRGRWPERSAVVTALTASLERQLGQRVGIISVAGPTHGVLAAPRAGRPDAVLIAERGDDAVRERLAARLAAGATEVALTLVEVDEALGSAEAVFSLADTRLVLSDGGTPEEEDSPSPARRIVLSDRRRGAAPMLADGACVLLPRAEARRGPAIDRLARSLTGRTIGIALGSGTAYGLAHIGVLAVLEGAGVPIDFIAGSSMGAVIGAGYALGMSAADLREVAVEFGERSSWLRMAPSLLGLALDQRLLPDLLGGDRFLRFLATFGPVRAATFDELEIPFRAVATDIETGARVEIRDGRLLDAIRASASVPGFLPPYRIGDRVLVDGGAADPVPSETVRAMGADLVLAVNAVPPLAPRAETVLGAALQALEWLNPLAYLRPERPPHGTFEVAMRSLHILQHELGNARAGEADVLINPRLEDFSMLEFWRVATIIDKGAEAARAVLPAIREKLQVRAARVEAA